SILFQQIPHGVHLLNSVGNFLDINTVGCLMLGYEKEELLKLNIRSLFPKEDLLTSPLKLEELNKGIPLIFERKFIRKNGSTLDVEIIAQKLQDGNIQVIIRDISVQKQTNELLRKSLHQLKEAQKIARSGHIDLDLVSGEIVWSDETYRIHACNPEAFKPTLENTVGFVHPEDVGFVQKTLQIALTGEEKYKLEYRIIDANGKTIYLNVNADIKRDTTGKPMKMLGTITDITEITQAKQKEELSARVLELLAKDVPLPTILKTMVLGAEQYSSGSFCSILLADKEGKHLLHGAAPSLPDFYNKFINGVEIGFGVGSSGTAAFTGKRIIVEDIQAHPYWERSKKIALKAGLAACWSEPILDASGKVLGTFAIYCPKPCSPKPKDIELIVYLANLSTIVLEHFYTSTALKESKIRLALTLDSTSDMMGLMDINEAGEFIFNTANRATREFLKVIQIDDQNYFGAELKAYCTNYLGFTKEEALELEEKYQQVVKERKAIIVSSSSPTPQRGLVYIETTINPVFEDNGKVKQILWVNKDVTEAKKTEEQLLSNEQKLNEAQKIAKIGSWEFNFLTNELNWSKEQYRIFELEGTSPYKLYEAYRNKFFPDDLQKLDELIKRTIETGEGYSFEHRIICKDGSIKHILGIGESMNDTLGKVIGLKGTGQDITHKVESQKQQLQSMILGEENERKRLAAELHDSLGQTLSLISLNLDSVLNLDEKKETLTQQKLRASLEMVNQTIEEIRSISHGLIPPALEDFGLESELEDMFNKAHLSTGIITHFSFDNTIGRCESNVEINIYRIAQEALHNTLKHADARKISISIYKQEEFLTILYRDDGKGFAPDKKKKTYNGLKNIENRVYVLGGTLSVQSVPRQGTMLFIKIPL
ncbi:MAG: PAS domain S-box-containing protein, partial [Saprospiraceae bacterium]